MTTYRGQGMARKEDERLLRGGGQFVDDIQLDGMLHAAVLRSTEPHARIRSIDTADALPSPGVAAVYTGADLDGVVPDIGAIRREGMGETPVPEHPVLARGRVCYVGQPVALVVASTRAEAFDARDRIAVDYDPLPPLLDPRESASDASPLHPDIGTNVVMRAAAGAGNVAEAFENADAIVEATYEIPRLVAMPMECRGIVAAPDAESGRLTVWTSTQVPHRVKTFLAMLLPGDLDVRVITPDVGGGFGRKIEVWPEEVAAAYAAVQLGAPVKWTEQRSESTLASHGRGFTADVEAAVRADGVVLGVRIRMLADMGAYFLTSSGGPLGNAVQRVAGPYAIPAMDVECLGVTTNRPPTGPYRGAGGPEAAVPMERIMDAAARQLGMDPAEIRRRNFIPADAFPYQTATGLLYDSGDFHTAFDRALGMAGYAGLRERQASESGPFRTGIGIATVTKASGGKAGVRKSLTRVTMTPDGRVVIVTDVIAARTGHGHLVLADSGGHARHLPRHGGTAPRRHRRARVGRRHHGEPRPRGGRQRGLRGAPGSETTAGRRRRQGSGERHHRGNWSGNSPPTRSASPRMSRWLNWTRARATCASPTTRRCTTAAQ